MKTMSYEKFVLMVESMRDAQKEYFKNRNKRILVRSIAIEGAVDKAIKDWHEENDPHRPLQQDLFENPT